MTPPRALAAAGVSAGGNPGKDVGASLRRASGTPPPAVCPGKGGSGRSPLIRPCGATFPQGGRQGLLLAAAGASAGRRGRCPLRVARGRAVTGACPSSGPAGPPSPEGEGKGCCWGQRKPPQGVGDAAPYGLPGGRAAAGACPSSGPAGPPSPKGEGKGCCWRQRKVSRNVGDAAPYGLPGNGQRREAAAGWGHPPSGWGYGNAVGFTWAPVSGPPRGRGRACPARGVTRTPVNGSVRREGS